MSNGLEENFISLVRNALFFGFSGNKELALPGNKKVFMFPRHKFVKCLEEMCIRKRNS
jgi:hypothetical protein